jgi:hypothetical protein
MVDALMGRPQRPKEVDEALERDYGDVEEWRARGGGIGPDDRHHIDEGGI